MNALPQATAIGYIHNGTMAGKLNGVMPPQTPSGCTKLYVSMPRATFSTVSPMPSEATLQACSTTSMPRQTSPIASSKILPVSRLKPPAMSS